MKILAFDCSTTGCAAAVVADGRLLARLEAPAGRGQAEALMPLLEEAMRTAAVRWQELDLVAVTLGPGSFTGLRIGLAAARGLALGLDVRVAGVPTPEAVAAGVPEAERLGRTVLVALDSKRAELFVQAFDAALTPLAPVAMLLPEDAAKLATGPVVLAGDAAERLAALLPNTSRSTASPRPDPVILARLAEERLARGEALPPEPLYLRPADVTLPGAAR